MFLLGTGTRTASEKGAILGLLAGTALAILHLAGVTRHWLHYGSQMNANFHGAVYAFVATYAVGWLFSSKKTRSLSPQMSALGFNWRVGKLQQGTRLIWVLSILLLLSCGAMNILWR